MSAPKFVAILLAVSGSFLAPAPAAPTSVPLRAPTGAPVVPFTMSGALILRLEPEAARRASVRGQARERRVQSLGVPDVDRAASTLGGAWFEPEFAGETAPGPGSDETDFTAFWIAHFPPGTELQVALEALRSSPDVVSAEPITVVPVEAVPNDSLWGASYYFYQASRRDLHAVEAWDVTTGDTSIVVAILDTGVLPYHPDLRDQIWTNPGERAGASDVDDDENGFVDDLWGWDFVDLGSDSTVRPGEDGRDADNDPNDFVAHGTAVAGVVGARTNNRIGVAGTAWNIRLMALRVGWGSRLRQAGEINLTYVAQAVRYATRMGASVINCSFSSVYQSDLDAAVSAATRAGVVVVVAAGNGGSVHYLGTREDVIAVAATDADDRVASFSNRGSYVDIAAPGVDLAAPAIDRSGVDSLGMRQPTYTLLASGTSFSAPLVSGAVALLQSQQRTRGEPPLRPMHVLMRLLETADDISATNPSVNGYGSGRLNLFRALTEEAGSSVVEVGARSVGPGAIVPVLSGPPRAAMVTVDRRLLVLDAAHGTIVSSAALPAPPLGGIAAADLGGGRGLGMFVATADGRISGFDAQGRMLPGWPVPAATGFDPVSTEPVLGDLDGDGVLEVLWGANGALWVWRADGTPVPTFPRSLSLPGGGVSIALSDLDGLAGSEIVAAYPDPGGGFVSVIRGDGTTLDGWPVHLDDAPFPPVVARLGSDPSPAVIVVGGNHVRAFSARGEPRWTKTLDGFASQPPAAGDLDGDGADEFVVVREFPFAVVVLDSAGRAWGAWPPSIGGQDAGPPLIGHLSAQGLGVLQPVVGGLLAFDAGGNTLPRFPKPGGAGARPSLADLDGDGRTEVLAGTGFDTAIYIYDAGPGSWSPLQQPWPTPRGNYARTGSRLYAPSMSALDNVPPAAVSDLTASDVGLYTAELRWTAPGDVGGDGRVHRYEMRRGRDAIATENFASSEPVDDMPAPGPPGTPERAVASGLDEGTTYFFGLRSFDEAGNPSPVSTLEITTPRGVPAAVTDLRVTAATDSTVSLHWTASGDDGASGRPNVYLIRAAEHPIDEASFDEAPIAVRLGASVSAGGNESATLQGVRRGRRYWIALKAEDDAGIRSTLSNLLSTWIGPLAARDDIALTPGIQPSHPPIEIYWQGEASSGPTQEIRIYDLAGRLQHVNRLGPEREGVMRWDGRDREGNAVRPGLYFARLASGGRHAETRIVLLP